MPRPATIAPWLLITNLFLQSLTGRPGIYQMFDGEGAILYVGKAKNLKKRVGSYFRKTGLTPKTAALVKRIAKD